MQFVNIDKAFDLREQDGSANWVLRIQPMDPFFILIF